MWPQDYIAAGPVEMYTREELRFQKRHAFAGLIRNGITTALPIASLFYRAWGETVEEFTQSLLPLVGENGMDWMYSNCSTTAQRGALDWKGKFRDATTPVFEALYESVRSGHEAEVVIKANSRPDYREKLSAELEEIANQEIWRSGKAVRALRPERQ